MFSARNFMASCLFRSLNLFEFIFVYDVRDWSNFIDSEVAVQLSQHYLLKSLSFLCCIFLLPFCRLIDCRCVVCFCAVMFHWSIYRFSCQYYDYYDFVALCEWRLGLLWLHINFRNICPSSVHLPLLSFPVESWKHSVNFISQVMISTSLGRECWRLNAGPLVLILEHLWWGRHVTSSPFPPAWLVSWLTRRTDGWEVRGALAGRVEAEGSTRQWYSPALRGKIQV